MTRTFQHAAVFQRLSCLDNVMIGLGRNGVWRATIRSAGAAFDTAAMGAERRAALSALEAVGLGGRARDQAGSLSLGDQRRLELARAIVSRPQLILLDEPVSGVAVEEAHRLVTELTRGQKADVCIVTTDVAEGACVAQR